MMENLHKSISLSISYCVRLQLVCPFLAMSYYNHSVFVSYSFVIVSDSFIYSFFLSVEMLLRIPHSFRGEGERIMWDSGKNAQYPLKPHCALFRACERQPREPRKHYFQDCLPRMTAADWLRSLFTTRRTAGHHVAHPLEPRAMDGRCQRLSPSLHYEPSVLESASLPHRWRKSHAPSPRQVCAATWASATSSQDGLLASTHAVSWAISPDGPNSHDPLCPSNEGQTGIVGHQGSLQMEAPYNIILRTTPINRRRSSVPKIGQDVCSERKLLF